MTTMKYRPDIDAVVERHRQFWALEEMDLPLIKIAPKDVGVRTPGNNCKYYQDPKGFVQYYEDAFRRCSELKDDTVPRLRPPFSHALIAGILGAEVEFVNDQLWAKPFVESWDQIDKLKLDKSGVWAKRFKDFYRDLLTLARGNFAVTVYETQGPGDLMATLRGPERLCLDCYDSPDEVKRLGRKCLEISKEFGKWQYELIADQELCGGSWITLGWAPKGSMYFCEHSIVSYSPDTYKEFIYPLDQELTDSFDHCQFVGYCKTAGHLMDFYLGLKRVEVIQSCEENLDSERIKKHLGKKRFVLNCPPQDVKKMVAEFGTRGICISTHCGSVEESKSLIASLR
jgi:hypothetical protein